MSMLKNELQQCSFPLAETKTNSWRHLLMVLDQCAPELVINQKILMGKVQNGVEKVSKTLIKTQKSFKYVFTDLGKTLKMPSIEEKRFAKY